MLIHQMSSALIQVGSSSRNYTRYIQCHSYDTNPRTQRRATDLSVHSYSPIHDRLRPQQSQADNPEFAGVAALVRGTVGSIYPCSKVTTSWQVTGGRRGRSGGRSCYALSWQLLPLALTHDAPYLYLSGRGPIE